tara:strand:+ start:506 stop:718 length:213 start_codon:yes stop_codon:yes gene_type:complete
MTQNQAKTEDLQDLITSSDNWLVIRFKEGEGMNLHFKNNDSIALLPMLLANQPDLWDIVKKTVWDIKKGK